MAKVTIDDQEYTTGPMKFKQLKKAYPFVQDNQRLVAEAKKKTEELHASGELPADQEITVNPIDALSNAIAIVAIALEKTHPELTLDVIEDSITLAESSALNDVIFEIIEESGFQVSRPGEGVAPEGAASPSTETSTD